MEQFLLEYSHLGPLAMLIGLLLPLGEELIIVPAGVFAAQGRFSLWTTWLCAYIGVLFSDSVWFFVARHYGTLILHRRWIKRIAHPRRLLQAKHQIERRGAWVIVTGRFLPGSRSAALIMAGMLHMPVWKFLLTEMGVVAMTVSLQLFIGYLIARGIGDMDMASTILTLVGLLVVFVGLGAAARWILAHRRSGREAPRAPARWLRRRRRRVMVPGPPPDPGSPGEASLKA